METEKTPEAKLLGLIKGGSKRPLRDGGERFRGAFRRVRTSAARFWFHIGVRRRAGGGERALSPLALATRCVAGLIIIFWAYFILDLTRGDPFDLGNEGPAVSRSMEDEQGLKDEPGMKMDRSSLQDLMRRDLFRPLVVSPRPAKPAASLPPPPPPPPKIPLSQRAAHLQVVGIISGAVPQAVIEDRRRRTTLYVTAGQLIDELQVEKISEDGVILVFEEERHKLPL